MTINLTEQEREFLARLLESVQLSGTPEQVRQALAIVDGLAAKVEVAGGD